MFRFLPLEIHRMFPQVLPASRLVVEIQFPESKISDNSEACYTARSSNFLELIPLCPGGSTGHYLEGDVRTGNRRIFWVLRETHFPWSVLEGKTGFRLLSSRNDQRRRRHGPEDPILIYFQKIVNFPPKVNLSPRLYSHPLPSESCTSYSKQPPLHAR